MKIDLLKYKDHFSESKFWEKLGSYAKKAGVKAVYAALLGYFVLKSPDVPVEDKAKVYGALGYFILPLDLLPDMIPVVGYADDLSALVYALHAVWKNVTPEIELQAKDKLREWFGDDINPSDLFNGE
ncbi:MAG: DUF1232 domain-containing protein [Bacteroidaceae bacterium]|nr:DUF1232 domain-containing protein [Bacteroidaceae bacterium]MBR1541961.1 DUF1232 domain-containing protein [Bacteroidaceae bacterium]